AHRELRSSPTRRSSDLLTRRKARHQCAECGGTGGGGKHELAGGEVRSGNACDAVRTGRTRWRLQHRAEEVVAVAVQQVIREGGRSEEHTSELQSRENLV